jgi:hypothetical protein
MPPTFRLRADYEAECGQMVGFGHGKASQWARLPPSLRLAEPPDDALLNEYRAIPELMVVRARRSAKRTAEAGRTRAELESAVSRSLPPALDNDVAVLNVTGLRQALSKRFPTTCQCHRSATRCGILGADARPNWKERP